VLAVPALGSWVALVASARIESRAETLGDELVPEIEVGARIGALINELCDAFEAAARYADAERFAQGRERAVRLADELAQWRSLGRGTGVAEISAQVADFAASAETRARLSVESRVASKSFARAEQLESRAAVVGAVEAHRAELRARLAAEIRNLRTTAVTSRSALALALVASTLLAVAIAASVSGRLATRVARVADGLRSASEPGGSRTRLELRGRDELSELAQRFNAFADANQSLLAEIAVEVAAGSRAVARESQRIERAGEREHASAEAAAAAVAGLTQAAASLRERTRVLAEEASAAIAGIRAVDQPTIQLLEHADSLSERSSDSASQLRELTHSIRAASASLNGMRELAQAAEVALGNVGAAAREAERDAGETLAFAEAALSAAREGARCTDESVLSIAEIERGFARSRRCCRRHSTRRARRTLSSARSTPRSTASARRRTRAATRGASWRRWSPR
jgi:methyl-accepting chemotaxis protein